MSTPTTGEIKFSDLNSTFGNANSELKFSEYEADTAAARIPDFKIGSTRSDASVTPSTPQSTNPISSIIGSDNYAIPTPYDNDASFFGAAQFGSTSHGSTGSAAAVTSNTNFGENHSLLCNFVNTGNSSSGLSTGTAPLISSNKNAANAVIGRQTTRYVYAIRGSNTHSNITDLTVEFLEDITGEGNSGVFKLTGSLTGSTSRAYEIFIIARDGGNNDAYLKLTGTMSQSNVTFSQPQLSMSQYHGLSASGFTDTWPSGITSSTWDTTVFDSAMSFGFPNTSQATASASLTASLDTSNNRVTLTVTSFTANGITNTSSHHVGYLSSLTSNAVFSIAFDYPQLSSGNDLFTFTNADSSSTASANRPSVSDRGSHSVRTRTLSQGNGLIGSLPWSAVAIQVNDGVCIAKLGLTSLTAIDVEFELRVVDSSLGIDTTLSYTTALLLSAEANVE